MGQHLDFRNKKAVKNIKDFPQKKKKKKSAENKVELGKLTIED